MKRVVVIGLGIFGFNIAKALYEGGFEVLAIDKHRETIQKIKEAVSQLSSEDLAAFRAWFAEFDAEMWDRQFEEDAAAGRLDRLVDEALRDLREGRCTDL